MTSADIKREAILEFIQTNPLLSSKAIHEGLVVKIAYATVKRTIQELVSEDLIIPVGKGKATRYQLSPAYAILQSVDPDTYFKKEIDERKN